MHGCDPSCVAPGGHLAHDRTQRERRRNDPRRFAPNQPPKSWLRGSTEAETCTDPDEAAASAAFKPTGTVYATEAKLRPSSAATEGSASKGIGMHRPPALNMKEGGAKHADPSAAKVRGCRAAAARQAFVYSHARIAGGSVLA